MFFLLFEETLFNVLFSLWLSHDKLIFVDLTWSSSFVLIKKLIIVHVWHGNMYFLQNSAAETLLAAMSKSMISCFQVLKSMSESKSNSLERELCISTSTRKVCKMLLYETSWSRFLRYSLGEKDFLHVPFISIHLIQMLAQHSLQAHLILMFQARVPFFPQLSLVVNLQRHRKPPIHLPFIDHKFDPVQLQSSWL